MLQFFTQHNIVIDFFLIILRMNLHYFVVFLFFFLTLVQKFLILLIFFSPCRYPKNDIPTPLVQNISSLYAS